jgi:hypothetical protein
MPIIFPCVGDVVGSWREPTASGNLTFGAPYGAGHQEVKNRRRLL